MSRATIIGALIATAACLVLWMMWGALPRLRGTLFWELRYVVFAVAGFLVLGLAERANAWFMSHYKDPD